MTANSPGDKQTPNLSQPVIYQMKVTVVGVAPPVWRRFQVRSDITFYELHRTLQIVMGWRNYHLYLFLVDKVELSDPVTTLELGTQNAEQTRLRELLHDSVTRFQYEYDLGDRWQHEIELEKRLSLLPEKQRPYPICLAGEGACPPEGVGGSRGYARFLESLEERTRPMSLTKPGQARPPFEPELFDLDKINKVLSFWH